MLCFESYAEMSQYIRAHGPLPPDTKIIVGPRQIMPHLCTPSGECVH